MAGRFIENIRRAREASEAEAAPKTDAEWDAELERALSCDYVHLGHLMGPARGEGATVVR